MDRPGHLFLPRNLCWQILSGETINGENLYTKTLYFTLWNSFRRPIYVINSADYTLLSLRFEFLYFSKVKTGLKALSVLYFLLSNNFCLVVAIFSFSLTADILSSVWSPERLDQVILIANNTPVETGSSGSCIKYLYYLALFMLIQIGLVIRGKWGQF